MKRVDDTKRFADTSLKILESYQIKEWIPRVYLVTYGMVSYCFKPIRDIEESLNYGIQIGLETGDLEFAMVSVHILLLHGFVAGKPLEEQEKRAAPLLKLMVEYKQDHTLALASPSVQAVHNLLGRSEDPCVLTGEIMNQEKLLEAAKIGHNFGAMSSTAVWRMVLAYIMNNYELALDMAEKCRPHLKRQGLMVFVLRYYRALASLALLQEFPNQRRKQRRKYVSNARSALKFLKSVSRYCPSNVMNKIFLLEAEFAVLKGKLDLAIPFYQRSIELSQTEGFLHEQALANERAGLALQRFGRGGDEAGSMRFLVEAHDLYKKWGSKPKMEQLA